MLSFASISNRLRSLADDCEEEPHDYKTKLRLIGKLSKELVRIILDIRDLYFLISYSDYKRRMYYDAALNEFVGIHINKNDFGYTLSIPFLLPKRSHSLNRSFWHISLDEAVRQFEEQYKDTITPISNPAVIFENQYVLQKTVKGLKDADNYELSDVLNFLQNTFYGDDRSVTLVIRNCGGFSVNRTVVHIINEDSLIEYLEKTDILLHPKT